MSINKRVAEWFELALSEGRTQTYFSNLWGVSKQSISGYVRGSESVGLNPILKILDFDKRLNARWLLFGEGEMYSSVNNNDSTNESYESNENTIGSDKTVRKLYEELVKQLSVKDDQIKGRDEQIKFLQQLIESKLS